jgi:phosphate transport system protein
MSQFWETQLKEIREQLLMMSGLAERNLAVAVRAFMERDDKLCDAVETEDTQIDHLEVHIDELVITFMATRAPVAQDCRMMLAASKIGSNLERIGDQATTIARRARQLNQEPQCRPVVEIPTMAEIAADMLRDSITAFIEGNADLAVEIVARDRSVNDLNRQVARELTAEMQGDSRMVPRALNLMTIAKALERVADHSTNIAEEVFYLYKGRDIRHEKVLSNPGAA